MDEHLVEGDGEGGVVAVDHHGGRVADEADVDAGHVEVDGGGVVVGGDDGDGLAPAVLLAEVGEGDALGRGLGLGAAVDGVLGDVAHAAEEDGGGGQPAQRGGGH